MSLDIRSLSRFSLSKIRCNGFIIKGNFLLLLRFLPRARKLSSSRSVIVASLHRYRVMTRLLHSGPISFRQRSSIFLTCKTLVSPLNNSDDMLSSLISAFLPRLSPLSLQYPSFRKDSHLLLPEAAGLLKYIPQGRGEASRAVLSVQPSHKESSPADPVRARSWLHRSSKVL